MGQVSVAHDSKGLTVAHWVGIVAVVATVHFAREGFDKPFYFGDGVAIAVIGGLLLWFAVPRNRPGHQSPSDSVAFRFGRKLRRVLRGESL
jgi:hypothetical protein